MGREENEDSDKGKGEAEWCGEETWSPLTDRRRGPRRLPLACLREMTLGEGGASSHGQLARRKVKGERYDEGEK